MGTKLHRPTYATLAVPFLSSMAHQNYYPILKEDMHFSVERGTRILRLDEVETRLPDRKYPRILITSCIQKCYKHTTI